MGSRSAGPIERASAADLGQLAADVGSVPNQVGAVLLLDGPGPLDVMALRATVAARLAGVPRLRQRLVATPRGSGPPIWIDDRDFDVSRHIATVACPPPGDQAALLAVAAHRVTTSLPRALPLWSVTLVTGVEDRRAALILVFHHVMADGLGGLVALAPLLDGVAAVPVPAAPGPPPPPPSPRPPPTRRQLRLDAATRRRSALRGLAGALPRLRDAIRELGGRPTVAIRTSLNRPTGSRRRVAVVRADLATVKRIAHAHEATVNDVLLVAVTGALAALLRHRGEEVDRLVVSVPIAARTTTAGRNQAGVAPVELPTRGTPGERLHQVAALTRAWKHAQRGSSAALLGSGLRVLGRLRLLRWFIDHQRMVHTFVTNLRGPDQPVSIVGMAVTDLVPISLTTGNVTVAFAAFSYAGALTVTVVADPTHHPDLDVLLDALHDGLGAFRSDHL